MSSLVTLAPCPRCRFIGNQGQVKYDYLSRGFRPYVLSEVNCRNCGILYDGKTNNANLAPAKNWLLGCFIYMSVVFVFFIIVMFVLGVFYSITK